MVEIRTRGANDGAIFRHLSGQKPAKQTWQDLTAGQIPSAAKDYKVERFNRDDTRDHEHSISLALLALTSPVLNSPAAKV
jgi:hypothetical protein